MIEQLYSDFTNNLLPKIQEGLTISKDYFIDLFGRYKNYLIIIDSIKVSIGTLILISGIFYCGWFLKTGNKKKWEVSEDFPFNILGFGMLLIFGIIILCSCLPNLIQDIYIPEIRMLEIIKNYK
jgi:hypothetical protein